jgi:glycosyltransferase involved in cell wall biosynthesis
MDPKSTMPQLTVVIPVYNETGNLRPLVGELEEALR